MNSWLRIASCLCCQQRNVEKWILCCISQIKLWEMASFSFSPCISESACGHACSVTRSFLTLLWPRRVAHQACLCIGFSKQKFWNEWPFLPPGNLPDPGIKPTSPALASGFFTIELPGEPTLHPQDWVKEFPNVNSATSLRYWSIIATSLNIRKSVLLWGNCYPQGNPVRNTMCGFMCGHVCSSYG